MLAKEFSDPRFVPKVLSLPKTLQTTLLALTRLGPSSAWDVQAETGKQRAVECTYLNMLVAMQLARSFRNGKRKFYAVDLSLPGWTI
jgi:hypothetical protein